MYLASILVWVVMVLVDFVEAQSQPPKIENEWKSEDYYKINSDFSFSCRATGIPEPKYVLLKNGNEIFKEQDDYRFNFTNMVQGNEGDYECVASNPHGESRSRKTRLRPATQVLFDKQNKAVTLAASTSKLSIECKPQIFPILPPGEYKWFRKLPGTETEQQNSKEIQIDHEGKMHISNMHQLRLADQSFFCETKNTLLDQWARSGETQITITNVNAQNEVAPQLMTASVEGVVAKDDNPIFKCLFSGYPTPHITWYDADDSTTELSRSDWTRTIDDTHIEYRGNFDSKVIKGIVCKGTNKAGDASHQIKIESKPRFLKLDDRLKDVTVTEGEDAVLRCVSSAEPAATITWFKNGEKLDGSNMPPNYQISADRSELSITGLCKTCNAPDLAVIQYLAENAHGSAVSEARINVLEKTTIDNAASTMKDVNWQPDQNVMFNVVAKGDPLTPLQYKWFFNDEEIIKDKDPRLEVNEGSLKIILEDDVGGGADRCGTYKCQVTNGYSSSEVSANLINTSVSGGGGGFAWWWILLIVLLILLILFLLLLLLLWFCGCLTCCTKLGEDYKVDENERSKGINPVKELREKSAVDYNSAIVNENRGSVYYNDNYNNRNSLRSKSAKTNINSFQNLAYNDDSNNQTRNTNMNFSQTDNNISDINEKGVYSISRQSIQGRNSRRKSNCEVQNITVQHAKPIRSEEYVISDEVDTGVHGLKKWSGARTDLRNEDLYATRIHTMTGPGYVDREDGLNCSDEEDSYRVQEYKRVHGRNSRAENSFNAARSSGEVVNAESFSFQNPAGGDFSNMYANFGQQKYTVQQQKYEINA